MPHPTPSQALGAHSHEPTRTQRVAVCCSVLQCVAVCCSVLQCVAVCCSVLQCAAVCCSSNWCCLSPYASCSFSHALSLLCKAVKSILKKGENWNRFCKSTPGWRAGRLICVRNCACVCLEKTREKTRENVCVFVCGNEGERVRVCARTRKNVCNWCICVRVLFVCRCGWLRVCRCVWWRETVRGGGDAQKEKGPRREATVKNI